MAGKYRTLIESSLYSNQLSKLGGIKYLDEVLFGVTWALCKRPDIFPIIPKTKKLRLVKTERIKSRSIEKFRIWFYITDKDDVELLAIEQEIE